MREISRRRFLKIFGATAVTLATEEVIRLGVIPYIERLKETPESVLAEIYKRHKIKIPLTNETEYAVSNLRIFPPAISGMQLESELIASLTLEEARLFKEGIEKVPGAGSLIQVILPYRFFVPGKEWEMYEVSQSTYVGKEWRGDKPYCIDAVEAAFRFSPEVDKETAIPFYIPVDFSPDEPLIDPDIYRTGVFGESFPDEPSELPIKTQGDAFLRVLVHEFGHGFEGEVTIRASSTLAEYCERRVMALCGFNSMDEKNPIFQTFSKLNGWKLVPLSEIIALCGVEKERKEGERWGWIRDPAVWGEEPSMRISHKITYGPIYEAFADFFMVSILYPEMLTDEEKRYFGKIHQGLAGDAEKFLDKLAQNPEILLS